MQTGLGDVPVKVPKLRDRSGSGIKFNSSLVPPYLKRTKAMEEFIPPPARCSQRWSDFLVKALQAYQRTRSSPQAGLGAGLRPVAPARSEPASGRVYLGRCHSGSKLKGGERVEPDQEQGHAERAVHQI